MSEFVRQLSEAGLPREAMRTYLDRAVDTWAVSGMGIVLDHDWRTAAARDPSNAVYVELMVESLQRAFVLEPVEIREHAFWRLSPRSALAPSRTELRD